MSFITVEITRGEHKLHKKYEVLNKYRLRKCERSHIKKDNADADKIVMFLQTKSVIYPEWNKK